MLHFDMAAFAGAKATERKALAILAHDNATADPVGADWRTVADMLRLAMPATKAKVAEIAADSRFAPWADYEIKGSGKDRGRAPVLVITMADGETVRAPALSNPGKPVNIGRGLRMAIAYYQCRISRRMGFYSEDSAIVNVPEFVSIMCETTGAEYDAADCNIRTAELRAGSFDLAAVTAEAANLSADESFGHVRRAFKVAAFNARQPEHATEYSDADREILAHWAEIRPGVEIAIRDAASEMWLTAGAAARLGWAVMTFWPDLADGELTSAPAEIASPVAETPAPPEEIAGPLQVALAEIPAPAEIAPPLPAATAEFLAAVLTPVAPSFKVPRRFLGSSRMVRIGPPVPVAPSCILRVAA